jgi:hypothetical protein
MDRSRLRGLVLLTLLAVVGVLLTGVTTPAWAHDRPASMVDAPPIPVPAPPAVSAADGPVSQPPSAATIWLVMVLTAALGLVIVQPRRALVLTLALIVGALAVEASVHSVHHLADRQAAAECTIAAVSANVHGAEHPSTPDGAWVATPLDVRPAVDVDCPGRRSIRPDEGRAPPAA